MESLILSSLRNYPWTLPLGIGLLMGRAVGEVCDLIVFEFSIWMKHISTCSSVDLYVFACCSLLFSHTFLSKVVACQSSLGRRGFQSLLKGLKPGHDMEHLERRQVSGSLSSYNIVVNHKFLHCAASKTLTIMNRAVLDSGLLHCDKKLLHYDRKLLHCDRELLHCDRELLHCDRKLSNSIKMYKRLLIASMKNSLYNSCNISAIPLLEYNSF